MPPINEQINELLKDSKIISEELETSEDLDNKETKTDTIKEDISALFEGEDALSEEFKTKAGAIFESAVVTRVKAEIERLEESYDKKLEEHKEEVKEGLVEHVDGFLNYVVEQWLNDNEVALESGIKLEISENLITGLHKLFVENNIQVSDEKVDLVSELEEKLSETSEKLAESVKTNIELIKSINEGKRAALVDSLSEGLTDVDSEKFRLFAEDLSFDDEDSFRVKLENMKETFFNKKQPATKINEDVITDDPILEEVEEKETKKELSPNMRLYVETLAKANS